ncbi:hypothetical protein [Xenorhabdus innexi]|uniref:Uncharacterized protein n=1 Tax=Xenorhabdus innexi TaxID=290109 RepID=A0A1N6MXH7_9GAMM|nr:hypothetical protein [Xenorhabdus innexi]PHM29996.1 hypothetical protein Xinn_03632 [Xenorhabdus innexi]SIP73588.1 hypothetical protein XIS1_40002 [Xenorhabdus innexi]
MKSKKQHHEKTEIISGLNIFQVHSILKTMKIYANGKMQARVTVFIQAYDANKKPVLLSEDQLASIKLIDYITGKELSGKWSYNAKKNKYIHTPPDNLFSQTSYSLYEEQENKTVQHYTYWVTTHDVNTINISAQIILNNKKYNIQEGSKFNSYVTVVGDAPIHHTADSLTIEEQKDIKSGKYKSEVETYVDIINKTLASHTNYYKWSQSNYYIKLKKGYGYAIKDAYVWQTANDDDPSNIEFRRFSYLIDHDNLYLFFIWGTYQEENKYVGYPDITNNVIQPTGDTSPPLITATTASPQVHLDILNPGTGVVSVTKLCFQPPYAAFWGSEFSFKPYFYFHDEYGNKSNNIRIIMNKDNQSFHLIDA